MAGPAEEASREAWTEFNCGAARDGSSPEATLRRFSTVGPHERVRMSTPARLFKANWRTTPRDESLIWGLAESVHEIEFLKEQVERLAVENLFQGSSGAWLASRPQPRVAGAAHLSNGLVACAAIGIEWTAAALGRAE